MTDCSQLESGGPKEYGIDLAHLNGEGDLVNHALPRPVMAREKFKILNIILSSLAVFVVDRLGRKKLSPDVLLHHVTMFKHLDLLPGIVRERRDGEPDVSVPFNVLVNPTTFESFGSGSGAVFGTTGSTAQSSGFAVDRPSRLSLDREWFPALEASDAEGVPLLLRHGSPFAAAFSRAIQRVSTMFDTVATELSRPPNERRPALFAGESNAINVLRAAIMGVVADLRTKLSIVGRSSVKLLAAMKAGTHVGYSPLCEIASYHCSVLIASAEFKGAA